MTPPRIRIDQAAGLVHIDGVAISLDLIKRIADADARVLWRFRREGQTITAQAYDEESVVWREDERVRSFVVGVVEG